MFTKNTKRYDIIKQKSFLEKFFQKFSQKIKPNAKKSYLWGERPFSTHKGVNNMDDLQIIELYFARDEQAIKETDRKYGKMCFRVAKNLLFNNEDSEECVNDTYLTVWNKIPPTRPNNFTAFICKITRNLSLKRLEISNAMKRSADAIISLSEIETTLPDYSIAQGVEDEELAKLISAFLWSEKELDRNVFLHKYWFFDTISDIAERYSMRENTVKSMLFRTRNRLREFLRKEGIEV